MSHFAEIAVDYSVKNKADLIKALEGVYGDAGVEVHDQLAELKMWNGSSALKENYYGTAPKCEIIVRRKTLEEKIGHSVATNDLGFAPGEDGKYTMHLDVAGVPKKHQDEIAQLYSVCVSERKLKAAGFHVKRQQGANGAVEVVGLRQG